MILAIDPGKKRTGWALISHTSDKRIIIRNSGVEDPLRMRDLIFREGSLYYDTVVIEKPV